MTTERDNDFEMPSIPAEVYGTHSGLGSIVTEAFTNIGSRPQTRGRSGDRLRNLVIDISESEITGDIKKRGIFKTSLVRVLGIPFNHPAFVVTELNQIGDSQVEVKNDANLFKQTSAWGIYGVRFRSNHAEQCYNYLKAVQEVKRAEWKSRNERFVEEIFGEYCEVSDPFRTEMWLGYPPHHRIMGVQLGIHNSTVSLMGISENEIIVTNDKGTKIVGIDARTINKLNLVVRVNKGKYIELFSPGSKKAGRPRTLIRLHTGPQTEDLEKKVLALFPQY